MRSNYTSYLKSQMNQIQEENDDLFQKKSAEQNHSQDGFNVTFGKQQKQFLNSLFNTPLISIHSQRGMRNKNLNKLQFKPNIQKSIRKRVQSSLTIKQPFNLKKQSEIQKIKQNISKLSYSIKTIQSKNNEEIGISSKRILMGTKQLQSQKEKNYKEKCKSSSNFQAYSDFHMHQNFNSQKQNQGIIIPHKKFFSKRLNVIVNRKSKSDFKDAKQQNSKDSESHFESLNLLVHQNPEEEEIQQKNLRQNKSNRLKQVKFNIKIQNKKLKYEQIMMKRKKETIQNIQSKKIELKGSILQLNAQNKQSIANKNVILPQSIIIRKRISLSNFLNKYQTEIVENTNNRLLNQEQALKPLRQALKTQFSSKCNYKSQITNLLHVKFQNYKKNFGKQYQTINQNGNIKSKKSSKFQSIESSPKKQFKRYRQIQKENIIY